MSLYLVATPIGNLEDITLRALRVLKEADLIACEDTRHSRRLLDHYGIARPLVSYHEHNERERAAELIERLQRGDKIALITDAGMPGISDPAYRVVTAAIAAGLKVIPLPGPTALITALVASGLPTDSFLFAGFLPAKRQARRERLESLRAVRETLVFYEAPHRILETLVEARQALGDRQAALARELTKLHEELLRGPLSSISAQLETREPRGEMALVIAGCTEHNADAAAPVAASMRELIGHLMAAQGLSRNDALKQAARIRGLSKKEAYRLLVQEQQAQGEEIHDEQHRDATDE